MDAGDYEAAVGMMHAAVRAKAESGWTFAEDYFDDTTNHNRGRYLAHAKVEGPHDVAPDLAGEMAALAVMVRGYLTMHVFAARVEVQVMVSRPATEEEIARHRAKKSSPAEAAP